MTAAAVKQAQQPFMIIWEQCRYSSVMYTAQQIKIAIRNSLSFKTTTFPTEV